ncbi:sugar transporter [Yersinia similis]|nr:sugar transporter [Yersinia similis]CNE62607.1 sugar transporter [Yersinia similis]
MLNKPVTNAPLKAVFLNKGLMKLVALNFFYQTGDYGYFSAFHVGCGRELFGALRKQLSGAEEGACCISSGLSPLLPSYNSNYFGYKIPFSLMENAHESR